MTDDDETQARRLEDEQFGHSVDVLRLSGVIKALRARLTRNQVLTKPIGRPPGSTVVSLEHLELMVDKMRREHTKLTVNALAREAHYARSTLTDWLARYPGTYDTLRARYNRDL